MGETVERLLEQYCNKYEDKQAKSKMQSLKLASFVHKESSGYENMIKGVSTVYE